MLAAEAPVGVAWDGQSGEQRYRYCTEMAWGDRCGRGCTCGGDSTLVPPSPPLCSRCGMADSAGGSAVCDRGDRCGERQPVARTMEPRFAEPIPSKLGSGMHPMWPDWFSRNRRKLPKACRNRASWRTEAQTGQTRYVLGIEPPCGNGSANQATRYVLGIEPPCGCVKFLQFRTDRSREWPWALLLRSVPLPIQQSSLWCYMS